jgi:hypothetical protein
MRATCPCLSHPPSFDHRNNVWWTVKKKDQTNKQTNKQGGKEERCKQKKGTSAWAISAHGKHRVRIVSRDTKQQVSSITSARGRKNERWEYGATERSRSRTGTGSSQGSSVNRVTRLWSRQPDSIPGGGKGFFLFATASRAVLGPTHSTCTLPVHLRRAGDTTHSGGHVGTVICRT